MCLFEHSYCFLLHAGTHRLIDLDAFEDLFLALRLLGFASLVARHMYTGTVRA